jgi:hypothetical protein
LCFFLPWVLVSCGNETPKLQSGLDIAMGTASTEPGYHGNPFVFLVPLAAIAVLVLAYLAFRRGHLHPIDGIGVILIGLFGPLYLYLQFGRPGEGVTIEYQYGLWGTVVGFIVILLGGVFNYLERRQVSTTQLQR